MDEVLDRVAGCELTAEFCEVMHQARADMYQGASIDPERMGVFVLLSSEIAMTQFCSNNFKGPVAGPILPTESRYFVLRGTRNDCRIQDVGV
ncbi:MAG: hypothetical protein AAGC81_19005, partial [Pseudomonadota bacterium]